ncbi:DUF397 domain-containing protein [Micromonospora cathayae]|uniref:DUF397 domain-containing protein n=1 Tax=Micromonospora cathayae TaxID=3028804 RepID=A0ABY7ZLC1_9ACTN|nr:DUF397 domain-containing protein [Micromonospora sp. HUAS 3]WDZ83764.1 DUF397 domain-containing protein [Micromonospora sp. HUAS 3]
MTRHSAANRGGPLGDTPTPVAWRKSSRSCQGNCVEVSTMSPLVLVRDSKDPDGPALRISRTAWRTFLNGMAGTTGGPVVAR